MVVKARGPLVPPIVALRVPVIGAPVPQADGNAQAMALATSVDVQYIMGQSWRVVEAACEYVLHTLASTAGCYDTRQTLNVSVTLLHAICFDTFSISDIGIIDTLCNLYDNSESAN